MFVVFQFDVFGGLGLHFGKKLKKTKVEFKPAPLAGFSSENFFSTAGSNVARERTRLLVMLTRIKIDIFLHFAEFSNANNSDCTS